VERWLSWGLRFSDSDSNYCHELNEEPYVFFLDCVSAPCSQHRSLSELMGVRPTGRRVLCVWGYLYFMPEVRYRESRVEDKSLGGVWSAPLASSQMSTSFSWFPRLQSVARCNKLPPLQTTNCLFPLLKHQETRTFNLIHIFTLSDT